MKKQPKQYLTPFQERVYRQVKKIPKGQTRSYKWVAEGIGSPNAYRAVGQALKKNTRPDIIPCHRVICFDGSIGGYNGGIAKKRYLLKKEGYVFKYGCKQMVAPACARAPSFAKASEGRSAGRDVAD